MGRPKKKPSDHVDEHRMTLRIPETLYELIRIDARERGLKPSQMLRFRLIELYESREEGKVA